MPTPLNNANPKSFKPYAQVQFIGYAISTVPKLYVENPAQPGINKYYLGLEDEKADIEARIELLGVALNAAQQAFQPGVDVFRIFVIPEFFFRGSKGAYNSANEPFLTARLQAVLQEKGPDIDLALFGTSLFCPQKVDYAHPATAKNFTLGDDFLNVYRACRDYREGLGLSTPSMQEMLFYLDELECWQDVPTNPGLENVSKLNNLNALGKLGEQAELDETSEWNELKKTAQGDAPAKQNFASAPLAASLAAPLAASLADPLPGPRSPLEAVLQEVLAASNREAPLLVSNSAQLFLQGKRHLQVQKQFKSKVDFVLNYYRNSARTEKNHNAYLQTFVKYPGIPPSNSELKTNDLDPYGIFEWRGLNIGIEICLDHIRQRMSKKTNNLDLHIIPSCGAEVTLNAVAAKPGGYVFNCDGDYNLEDAENGLGSHTQLYQVKSHAQPSSPNGKPSLTLPTHPTAKLGERIQPKQIIKIQPPNKPASSFVGIEALFPFGAGELHVYPALNLPKNH